MTASELKAARTAAGLTQKQLAAKLGVVTGAVSHWEQSRNPITKPMALLIAITLKELRT